MADTQESTTEPRPARARTVVRDLEREIERLRNALARQHMAHRCAQCRPVPGPGPEAGPLCTYHAEQVRSLLSALAIPYRALAAEGGAEASAHPSLLEIRPANGDVVWRIDVQVFDEARRYLGLDP